MRSLTNDNIFFHIIWRYIEEDSDIEEVTIKKVPVDKDPKEHAEQGTSLGKSTTKEIKNYAIFGT